LCSVNIIGVMATKKIRNEGVYIRLTTEEREAMETLANHDERTLADWFRRLARHAARESGLLSGPDKKPRKRKTNE